MEDNISKIKDRIDIVDLVGSYLKLQKSGVNFKARCPFHNEKTGSFFVSPERQIWHCFGCGLGGDIFTFIKQIEGVEFSEALRMLAARAGVELKYVPREYRDDKSKLYEINELAARFFEKQLGYSNAGRAASDYLISRGISRDSIKKFRIGYAPDAWDSLYAFLRNKYGDKEIENAGLCVPKKGEQGFFDRFRSRIMFPIADLNGQVVGFTGRVFGDLAKKEGVGKYVNSPQTLIYDKSRILYGLDKARLDIRRANRCLIVEGNTDVIMSHQAGVINSVASSGTALTEGHLKIIKRYTNTVDLCFDTDSAGDIATQRAVALALSHGLNVNVLTIDEGGLKDPADYIKAHGALWGEYIKKAKPFMEFYFNKLKGDFDLASAYGKKLFTQRILPMLASIASNIEKEHWLGETALALRIKEEVLRGELERVRPIAVISEDKGIGNSTKPVDSGGKEGAISLREERLGLLEESLLALLMREPKLVLSINHEYQKYLSKEFKYIMRHIDVNNGLNSRDIVAKLISAGEIEDPMTIEFAYLKSQELWNDFSSAELEIECKKLLNYIKRRNILAHLESLEYDIKSAEKGSDNDRINALLAEFSKLSHEIAEAD